MHKTSPRISISLASLLFLSAVSFSGAADAREIASVNVPDSVAVDGKELKLNGAGLRKKFIIKVYVGALYLAAPATTIDGISGHDQPWSIHMTFVRSVGKQKIIDAYREGFEKNSKDKAPMLNAGLEKLLPAIVDAAEGTEYVVTYTPGKGLTLGVKDGKSATVDGKEFADGLLRNWLGPEPADSGLKEALLAGGK